MWVKNLFGVIVLCIYVVMNESGLFMYCIEYWNGFVFVIVFIGIWIVYGQVVIYDFYFKIDVVQGKI